MEVGKLYRLKKDTYMQDKQHREFYKFDTDYIIEKIIGFCVYLSIGCVIDIQYFKVHFELSPIEIRYDKINQLSCVK